MSKSFELTADLWQEVTAACAGAVPPLSVERVMLIGSRAINGSGADVDVCVLVSGPPVHAVAPAEGWALGGSAHAGDSWESWKRVRLDAPELNLIVTGSAATFETWRASTEAARYMRGVLGRDLRKRERVARHRIIQEGCCAHNATPDDVPEGAP